MKAMGTLPHDKQLQVASGFRVMADRFKLALQEILTSRGAGATVTGEDMQQILQQLEAPSGEQKAY